MCPCHVAVPCLWYRVSESSAETHDLFVGCPIWHRHHIEVNGGTTLWRGGYVPWTRKHMRIFCEAGGFAQQTDHWFCMLYYVNLKLRLKPLMAAKTQLALVKGQNAMLGLRTHYEQPNLFYLQQYCLKQRFQLTANTFIWTCVLNKSDIPRIFVRFIWQIRAVMCAVNVTAMASGHVCDRQTPK